MTQPARPASAGVSVGTVLAGLTWHMLQVARNEQSASLLFYPGN
ncbi:hypothetical protein [Methylobacterium nigriterrae]